METIIFRFPVKFRGCSFFFGGRGGEVEVTGVSQKLQVSKGVFCLGRGRGLFFAKARSEMNIVLEHKGMDEDDNG